MIPDGSTPIKNEILIEIIAKGLLNKDEIRVMAYIIRWSWGFDGVERRQDWTKPLQQIKIAQDIGMNKGQLNRILKKMIKEKKILEKDVCYQFNEHYEKWIKVDKLSIDEIDEKVDNLSTESLQIINQKLIKSQPEVDNLSTLGIPNNQGDNIKNKGLKGGEHSFKETLKENNKETIKEKGIIFSKTWKDFKEMRRKIRSPMTKRAEELILQKLKKLDNNEDIQIAILNQSIMNSWRGVFPLKKESDQKIKTMKDYAKDLAERWEKEEKEKEIEI